MNEVRSLSALTSRAKAVLIEKTGQNNPAIDALANAMAAMTYGQYGYQDNLFRQLHPETCNEAWLEVHANRHGVPRILATFAKGAVRFRTLGSAVMIARGTRVVGPDNQEYETLQAKLSTEAILAVALTEGEVGNLPSGVTLKLSQAIDGIDANAVQSLGFEGGAEVEDIEHWRMRVCAAFNDDTTIGRDDDYEIWAKSSHADIDFAWVLGNTPSVGLLEVYVGQRQNDPLVSSAVVEAAQQYIDKKRLAGCHPVVKLPTVKPVRVVIQNITDEGVQIEVRKALEMLFLSKMGVRDSQGQLVSLSPTEIVLTVAEITSNYLVVEPREELTLAKNEIHVLGELQWT